MILSKKNKPIIFLILAAICCTLGIGKTAIGQESKEPASPVIQIDGPVKNESDYLKKLNASFKPKKQIESQKENKIDARPVFIPMHQQPIYKNGKKYPVAERLSRQGLSLPSYVNIREEDQMRVCETILTIILAR